MIMVLRHILPFIIIYIGATNGQQQQQQQPQTVHKKFEYKHSFRTPNLAQRDGTIPFWEIGGDAIASGEQLRLVPSMRSRKGFAWNKKPMTESEFWEVDITLKVTGQGRIGADGMAFWYTANKGTLGPVFGSNDYWTGMGLFLDSFDNDGQKNNPYIMIMINDGTRSYDHQTDGSQQMLTGCQKDFRNRPFPIKLRIQYLRNVVTVMIHDGMTQHERFEICMRAENIFFPRNGYFGFSAATGGLADDHDVLSFNAYSLMTEAPKPPGSIPQDERKKYDAEFEKQYQDFQEEREKFKKEHPDKVKTDEDYDDFAKYFEDATARELRLIYESQNNIHQVIQKVEGKLNQIIQQQNQHTQTLSQVRGGGPAPAAGSVQQGGGHVVDTFQRHEVNEVMQLTREISGNVRDMKNYVNEIYTRTYNVEQKLASGGGVGSVQQAGGGGGADQFQFQSVRTHLEGIKHDVEQIRTNQVGGGQPSICPEPKSCLTSTFFFVVIAGQSAIIFLFILLRKGQDKAKFY